jgi:hypothetical protein
VGLLSSIRRFFETLQYVPGYYRVFFLYLSIILMVFIYVVFFRRNPFQFVVAAVIVIYSGLGVPIVVQGMVGKLSRSTGWWAATVIVLVGLYAILRFLVAYELLDTRMFDSRGVLSVSGLVYWANIYGIIWTGCVAVAGVINMGINHGISGVRENLRRDFREISVTRHLTRGEPLILDKRTLALVLMAIVFTAGIFMLRGFLVQRPDLVTEYTVPKEIFEESPRSLVLSLKNNAKQTIGVFESHLSGYYRYPVFLDYGDQDLGKDLLKLARSIDVVAEAFDTADGAPADTILIEQKRETAGNIKEIFLDFTAAYSFLGLYINETAVVQLPSKFLVQWDRKEKRLAAVWVGTPGLPFMRVLNATRLDGRGLVRSSEPYTQILIDGRVEMTSIEPGEEYGYNLTGVYHPWLGERFEEIDQFFVANEGVLDGGRPRSLIQVIVLLKK